MIESNEFKNWLKENSKYSDAVIGDTVSRMKRADHILEWEDDELYQYHLEHLEEYSELSVSVRSQIKRAVKWYNIFIRVRRKTPAFRYGDIRRSKLRRKYGFC